MSVAGPILRETWIGRLRRWCRAVRVTRVPKMVEEITPVDREARAIAVAGLVVEIGFMPESERPRSLSGAGPHGDPVAVLPCSPFSKERRSGWGGNTPWWGRTARLSARPPAEADSVRPAFPAVCEAGSTEVPVAPHLLYAFTEAS
jgi:hypothetical protein